jgi:hypothetical protein
MGDVTIRPAQAADFEEVIALYKEFHERVSRISCPWRAQSAALACVCHRPGAAQGGTRADTRATGSRSRDYQRRFAAGGG